MDPSGTVDKTFIGTRLKPGFTLVEMIVVVALVVVATTMFLIRMDSWIPKYRLRAEARKVALVIETARRRAVLEDRAHIISYHLGSGEFATGLEGEPPKTHEALSEGIIFRDLDAGDESASVTAHVDVRFDPSGIVKKHILRLHDDNERTISLLIHPLVNEVDIVEGQHDLR